MMKKAWVWLLILSLATLFLSVVIPGPLADTKVLPFLEKSLPAAQKIETPAKPGRVFLITVDRLTLKDIVDNQPLFNDLTKVGAVGLVSTGVEGGNIPDNTFVSMGAGAPTNASGTTHHGVNARTQLNGILASDIFHQRTGLGVASEKVVQLDIEKIKKQNSNNKFTVVPGYLGTLLQDKGYFVEVYGNSDTVDQHRRPAVALAMNSQGVTSGDVSQATLLEDKTFPGGLRTDYQRLFDLTMNQGQKEGLTVVELGDLERLERMGGYLEENILQTKRLESMTNMVSFISAVIGQMDPQRDLVLVVAPTPRGSNLPDTNYLTPVLAAGSGFTPGLLTSPTTKRPGVIRNTDLAPTILNYFHLPAPSDIYGRCLQVIPGGEVITKLFPLYAGITLNFQVRPPLLRYYVLAQLALVFLSLAAIFMPKRQFLMSVLKPLLLAVMVFPVALLLLTLFPHGSAILLVTQLIAITMALMAAVHLISKNPDNYINYFIMISLFTSVCIAMDILLGAPMQKNSLLGYDPVVGARFYGIGNEYMGVLIGATIIGTTALINVLSKNHRPLSMGVGVYYLAILYLIAAPQLGTNVGGSIAAAVSFLVTVLLLMGVRFDTKTVLKVVMLVGTLLLVLVFYDFQRLVESQSHIGRTAHLILQGGPGEIIQIITRKVSMNIKLVKYTVWSRIFLASLVTLAILFYRPVGVMNSIRSRYPYLYKGFIGVVMGSLIAFIFNDSGVVAAATAMIFGAPPLLYLVISTIHGEQPPEIL